MRCLDPRNVGFKSDGKTLAWSYKEIDPQYATFCLPCSKCKECRLEYARQWAVRCVHEAKMWNDNSFITLTYSDEHVTDKLYYVHFQNFMKRLRDERFRSFIKQSGFTRKTWSQLLPSERSGMYADYQVGLFSAGEYGDDKKRPHWHAIIFNWRPTDLIYKYSNERGDRVFRSENLSSLWPYGFSEVGSVTFESAGYVARYSAKKLVHGYDQDHDFHPISKKSSKHAIGKKFLESYWKDIFSYGEVILPNGVKCGIPRYYEKWLKTHKPAEWDRYFYEVKLPKMIEFQQKAEREHREELEHNKSRALGRGNQISKKAVKKKLMDEKFKRLQSYLKGDI